MGPSAWHAAVDFDVSGSTHEGFDVLAPADGFVLGNGNSVTLCLKHTASNGEEFLTVYSHILPASKAHLQVGTAIRRGEAIGRVQEPGGAYTHLHFGVAVRGPSRMVNGA